MADARPDDLRICGFAQHEMALLAAGDGDRALGRLRLALQRVEVLRNAPEAERAEAAFEVGLAYDGTGDAASAERWFAEALAVPAFREGARWPPRCLSHALRYLWRGAFADAEPFAREAVAHARAGQAPGTDALAQALVTHGEALLGLGRPDAALPLLDEARAHYEASPWMQQFRAGLAVSIRYHEGRALAAMDRPDDALRCFDEAEALSAGWTTRARLDLLLASAELRRTLGRTDEATARARRARAWWDDVIALRREGGSGEAIGEAERERAALTAAWGL